MTIDDVRRQIGSTAQWPITIRVDGRSFMVERSDDIMIPPAGNLICIYHGGAFHIVDWACISLILKETATT